MRQTRYLLTALLGMLDSSLQAGTRESRLEPFQIAPDFQLVETEVHFRFTVFEESPVENESTHILIDGLSPVEEGSLVYTSTYRGIDIKDRSVYDFGQVLLKMPEGGSSPSSSSPIVGIVERQQPLNPWSGWSAFETNWLADTQLTASTGYVEMDSVNDGTMNLSFNDGNLTGTAQYVVVDDFTLEIADFSLTRASTAEVFGFVSTQMTKGPEDWYGVLLSSSAQLPDDYDSLMYQLRISRQDARFWGGYRFIRCPEDCGWVDATSNWLGYINIDFEPLVYNLESDLWMHLSEPPPEAPGGWAYIMKNDAPYTPQGLGWAGYGIYSNTDGSLWVDTRSNWMGFLSIDQAPFYYWYELDLWIYSASEPDPLANGAWFYVFKRQQARP